MRYTYELYLDYTEGGVSKSMQVRDMLTNWDDVEMAFKRSDYDGVVRSFSTSFEFGYDAREVLISQFLSNGYSAAVTLRFKSLQENFTYADLFVCPLDFTTFSYDDYTAKISAVDTSVAAKIKAKKSTKYTMPISPMQKNWLQYEGLPSSGYGTFKFKTPQDIPTTSTNSYYASLGLAFDYDKLPDFGDVNGQFAENGTAVAISGNLDGLLGQAAYDIMDTADVSVVMDVTLKVTDTGGSGVQSVTVGFAKVSNVYAPQSLQSISVPVDGAFHRVSLHLDATQLQQTYSIVPYLRNGMGKSLKVEVQPTADNYFTVKYLTTRGASAYMPIVEPSEVGYKLLENVLGMSAHFDFILLFETNNTWFNYAYILSGDAINIGSEGNIVTSWTDFCEWLKCVFGMIPTLGTMGGKPLIKFVDRSSASVFGTNTTNVSEFTELEVSVQRNLIYSEVQVGYEHGDVDDTLASEDFCNSMLVFSTGATNVDSILTLKSPYKGSPWLIEQAVRQRDTTQKGSTDVYFVGAAISAAGFDSYDFSLINRANFPSTAPSVSGCENNNHIFNTMYNPRAMAQANAAIIGACTDTLQFTSFENGNAKAVVNGDRVAQNLANIVGVFGAEELVFETADNTILADWSGKFVLISQGRKYTGYLKDTSFSVARHDKVRYTLIISTIEIL